MKPAFLAPPFLAMTLVLTGCGSSASNLSHPAPLRRPLPSFTLVTDDGAPLTSETLRGQAWIACFLFTSCGSVCPAMVGKIQVLQHSLPEGVPIVSISVDPERDTPAVLSEFAAFHQRAPGRWLLATGEWPEISRLASEGFGLAGHQRGIHSPKFGLVDGDGNLRGHYDSRDGAAMTQMLQDLAMLETPAAREVRL